VTDYSGMMGHISTPLVEGCYEVLLANETIEKRIRPKNLQIVQHTDTFNSPKNLDFMEELHQKLEKLQAVK